MYKLVKDIIKQMEEMVGVAGFKPTTSPTPRVRAIRLRYTPQN